MKTLHILAKSVTKEPKIWSNFGLVALCNIIPQKQYIFIGRRTEPGSTLPTPPSTILEGVVFHWTKNFKQKRKTQCADYLQILNTYLYPQRVLAMMCAFQNQNSPYFVMCYGHSSARGKERQFIQYMPDHYSNIRDLIRCVFNLNREKKTTGDIEFI